MFGIGGGELIFIIFIALMLFGSDKYQTLQEQWEKVWLS
jgi:sec-independent protein translocase protein TatA